MKIKSIHHRSLFALLMILLLAAASVPGLFGSVSAQNRKHVILGGNACDDDTWTTLHVPDLPFFPKTRGAAVWTGSEILVWGMTGQFGAGYVFDPSSGLWTLMNGANQPNPQTWLTAVWTGQFLIVWGGTVVAGQVTLSGGRYYPPYDVWSPMDTTGSPYTPGNYAAVWTGTDMLVYGPGGGGRYDPNADVWTPISTDGAPPVSANKPVSLVWTGSEAIVWGSKSLVPSTSFGPSGGRYNQSSDTWQPISTDGAPQGTDGAQAVWTGKQMIVWNNDGDPGIWDPLADAWMPLPPMNLPQGQAVTNAEAAVWTGHELLVWGQTDSSLGAKYNPASGTWRTVSGVSAPPPGSYLSTWTGNQLFVLGPATELPPDMIPVLNGGLYCAKEPPPICSFTLDSGSQSFAAAGGSGNIQVTAATQTCQWTAAADSSWINLESSSGTGDGLVNYSVAANTGSDSRTGHITISGQNFTITQSGGPGITSVTASGKNVVVTGVNFDSGAVVLVNGAPTKKTLHDPQNPNMLTGKKGLKNIPSGNTIAIQVRNSDDVISDPFPFVRP